MTALALRASSDAALKALFAVLLAASLVPVLLVPIPAMVDYPNHLARMFVLARDGTSAAHPLYEVAWAPYPNLAMDLIVPALARVVGVELATRLFLLISQVLIVTGAVAIELAVKGRFHIAGLFALLLLYSVPFAWGFLNFEFGLGIALWGVAFWIVLEERSWPVRLAVNALFVTVIGVAHLFALGIYGVTLGLVELHRAWIRRAPPTEAVGRLVVLAAPAGALFAVMAIAGGSVGQAGSAWLVRYKPLWLVSVVNGYSLILSAFTAATLAAALYVAARRGALRLERAGAWLATGFGVLFLVTPFRLLDTSFVDLRVVVAAALILPAFLWLSPARTQWRLGLVAGLTVLVIANLALVCLVWTAYSREYDAMIASFRHLAKGSLVLVGHSGEGGDPPRDLFEYPIHHGPTLAVHYADAFVPTLFSSAGKQPVTAHPSVRHLDVPYGGPAPSGLLKAIAEGRGPPETPAFIRSWHRDFDYLYVVGPRAPNPLPDLLHQIAAGSRFVLYRIRKRQRAAYPY